MDDNLDELVIDVRANTDSFASDLKGISEAVDTSLGDGFEKAGSILEKSLLKALRKGTLGFEDLKNTALSALSEIATAALSSGINALFGGSGSNGSGFDSGLGNLFSQLTNSLFGSPGRATGGPVSPGRSFVVGESGPELFVPTSAGRIEPNSSLGGGGREVRVAIQLTTPRGTAAPTAMQRSSRQVASAVRRALQSS
ncbi:MAG: tail tape measure protein [Erythrobacter sp.]